MHRAREMQGGRPVRVFRMMATEPPRRLDDKARREAVKIGLIALRARGRRAANGKPGGFRLLDRDGICVAGEGYELSAQDVIEFCNRIP